jgi:heterodisulfide reductase subunit A
MSSNVSDKFDVIIFGGGIAGMQSALDLADQDYKVAIIEKDASIGGKMIRLDKVFPTLDCASCITTPKMASVAHHRNISIFTLCELEKLDRIGTDFKARILKKPRYVDQEACIGCRQCEYGCPVMAPDSDQRGLSARKAIYIPFSNAIPQVALLDIESCVLCGKCEKICPTNAVRYFDKEEVLELEAKACILASGYQLLEDFPTRVYGEPAENPNVIDALQLERILAPTGPYMEMLRPGDGKEPESVAFIQCAGSRDETNGVRHCSRVCCMYAIKNSLLIQQELPETRVTIFYIDMRAFGKNYEQFYQNAKKKGIRFVKARPIIHSKGDNESVVLRYEDQEGNGNNLFEEFDMVVMSLAVVPAWNPSKLTGVSISEDDFVKAPYPKVAPTLTDREGIFVAGIASGPKDIVDTIVEAGSAAMETSNYLKSLDSAKAAA